ncbi:MAG: GNAT family N-acetyltransferase [Cellvibrionaceae bacterium]
MEKITIRPAMKKDCRKIAELYSISSDGVADYVWTKIAEPEEEIIQVGTQRYERENTDFSYQNCTIAETEGKAAGMLLAFPIHVDNDYKEEDPVLAPYFELEEDNSYYISSIALFPEHRNKGIGKQLMTLAETHAKEQGFNTLSLIVFEQNSGAKHLYEQLNYQERKRTPVYPHPLIRFTGDAFLMVKELR